MNVILWNEAKWGERWRSRFRYCEHSYSTYSLDACPSTLLVRLVFGRRKQKIQRQRITGNKLTRQKAEHRDLHWRLRSQRFRQSPNAVVRHAPIVKYDWTLSEWERIADLYPSTVFCFAARGSRHARSKQAASNEQRETTGERVSREERCENR